MSEPLLKIDNLHNPQSGDPPIVTNDSSDYIGYFENRYGEQWVFTCNRQTKKAELRGGDAGWNEIHKVQNGIAPGLVLAAVESLWLKACWTAAVGDQM